MKTKPYRSRTLAFSAFSKARFGSALVLLPLHAAIAHDARCDAAPYGADPVEYAQTQKAASAGAKSDPMVAKLSQAVASMEFSDACQAKFNGIGVEKFKKLGANLTTMSVGQLAAISMNGAIRKSVQYQTVTFRDFQIDGPLLAQRNAAIEITAAYQKSGDADLLFADAVSASYSTYGSGEYGRNVKSIPLLTAQASHAIRERMFDCGARNDIGCTMTLRGRVGMCAITNSFGAVRNEACLNVESGK